MAAGAADEAAPPVGISIGKLSQRAQRREVIENLAPPTASAQEAAAAAATAALAQAAGTADTKGGLAGASAATKPAELQKHRQLSEQSTQLRHWRFTAEQIAAIREQANAVAVARIKHAVAREQALHAAAGTTSPLFPAPLGDSDYITAEEQTVLCRYFEIMIGQFRHILKFDVTLQATAVAFFRRFYLFHSVMEYDPKTVVLNCTYLALKVEDKYMALKDFCRNIKNAPDPEVLLDMETKVIQGLQYELAVHHPYWPLHGFFLDMQAHLQTTISIPATLHAASKKLANLYVESKSLLQGLIFSDAIFQYSPAQLALGCFVTTGNDHGFAQEMARYTEDRFLHVASLFPHGGLVAMVERIGQLAKAQTAALKEDAGVRARAAPLARKLAKCRNPALLPDTLLFKQLQAEDAERQQAKRSDKAAKEQAYHDALDDVVAG
ncbi:hypothetical protein CXG81DRAFT_28246 [Caulochytrium protostelioides]|uniref:Cyclin-like domain-containing protein n=1 Tax=Caulochytrium protostelioides TaxID=1555241 RepID=A0A4P9WZQ9_9FUNG|nr:hypothetical protein CXG81DRAFT_28246 [Caulochytrium protostelioides]|eukprot:RKO98961.1 hypothetical protein CXG81DRAFT_28246 [Caulochytrium protostelioides]